MSDFQTFRSVDHFNQPLLIEGLEENLRDWCKWALLKIGAFVNVQTGNAAGRFGGDASRLHQVNDPSYTTGTVFQSERKEWIWETTGVNYYNITGGGPYNPQSVQVYINNSGITTGTVGYTHYINYPLGRIVFDSAQTATIKADYSYRAVQVYTQDETNWQFEINYDTENPAITQWVQNLTSGDFEIDASRRIQLPAIVVQAVPSSSARPFELGTLVSHQKTDVLFHVLTQDRWTRNNLLDIFRLQKDKTIILYDLYKVYTEGYLPLDYRGMVVNNPTIYPDIVSNANLVFRHANITNTSITNIDTKSPLLFWGICRCSIEIIY